MNVLLVAVVVKGIILVFDEEARFKDFFSYFVLRRNIDIVMICEIQNTENPPAI